MSGCSGFAGCPCPSGELYTHVHMGCSNWTQWVKNEKEMILKGRHEVGRKSAGGGILEETGVG